jgi:signal transduction histidine kinase
LKNILTYITKSSKLIIVYLVTVIVAGSILTYLGINNISNFKELTEKRITEEEKAILEDYSKRFHTSLENLSESLVKKIQQDSLSPENGALKLEGKLIKNYMIASKNGVLLRPRFVSNGFKPTPIKSSPLYNKRFHKAEQYEFIDKEFSKAETAYLNTIKYAQLPSDSAKTYNALARLKNKTGDQEGALVLYKKLITEFNFTCNNFGFPYSYFSIDQLLKIDDSSLQTDKEELVVVFLQALLNYKTPYTNTTIDLIASMKNKPEETFTLKNKALVDSLMLSVSNVIKDIDNYGPAMNSIATGNQKNQSLLLNDFQVIQSENNRDEILLLYPLAEHSVGFIVPIEAIDNIILKNLNLSDTNFEYTLNIVDAGINNNFFNNDLIIQSNFSPYFTEKRLQIALKDKRIVTDFVFKRKLTTAIGLILLLGAMIIGLVILSRDVNRKKRMAKLRADFVANVTHELKTPLTSINMFADSILLNRVKNEKDIKKYANVIVKESEKLKRMVNNILDFSRKESDKLNFQLQKYNLAEIIQDIMLEMNYWLEIHKFEVQLNIEDAIVANVDPEGLKQVLSNLITNAIKYSDTEKKIEIRLYKKTEKAYIEVSDHGIGIPEDKLPHIFEKFYRVNSNKNENITGTGLGLTVSAAIIEAQQGELRVKSTLNKGSTFTIIFNI